MNGTLYGIGVGPGATNPPCGGRDAKPGKPSLPACGLSGAAAPTASPKEGRAL